MMNLAWLLRLSLVLIVCVVASRETLAQENVEVAVQEKAKVVGGAAVRAVLKVLAPAPINIPGITRRRPLAIRREAPISFNDLDSDEKLRELAERVRKNPIGARYIKQFEPKFEMICRGELRFMHQICCLNRSQFLSIQKDARKASRRAMLVTVQSDLQ